MHNPYSSSSSSSVFYSYEHRRLIWAHTYQLQRRSGGQGDVSDPSCQIDPITSYAIQLDGINYDQLNIPGSYNHDYSTLRKHDLMVCDSQFS
uniref:Uncharacterized protein n=1 Tax=Echinococcus granulosus TaxID=6210 RepID=A0A068W998_ECHGR|nr:hypothetical protein EgrG_002020800 [Echinococcus granulosus]